METAIINGIFTIIGVSIGGLIAYISNKDIISKRIMKEDLKILGEQVISYWNLEKLYSEEIAKNNKTTSRAIIIEYRTKMVENQYIRPTMTEKEVKKILNKHRL